MKTINNYQKSVNRLGKFSLVLAFIWFFTIPVIICAKYNIFPSLKVYMNASLGLFLILTPVALSEIISFVPLMGAGASYLGFITGNVSNLKLPCAMNAMKIANVEPGTEESEVLSTISVAISSIITTFILIIGVIILVPFAAFFTNKYVIIATSNIIPALFGSMLLSFVGGSDSLVKGQWKAAVVPFILVFILHYFIYPISGFEGVVILIMIPVILLCAKYLHKKGQIVVLNSNMNKQ